MNFNREARCTVRYLVFAAVVMHSATALCHEDHSKRAFYRISKVNYQFPTLTDIVGGTEIDGGGGVSFELLHGTTNGLSIGIGAEYQNLKKTWHTRMISFVPGYILVRGTVYHNDFLSLYVGGQGGKTLLFINNNYKKDYKARRGGYFGIRFGAIIKDKVLFEGGWSILSGNLLSKESSIYDDGIACPQFSLSLGMIFH